MLRSLRLRNFCIKTVFVQSCDKFKWNALSAKSISTTSHTFNNIQFTDFSESIKNLRAMNPDIKIRDDPVVAKLDTSVFKSIFTKNLVDLVDIFKKYNYEIRIAGGAVRDLLMNKLPSDLDFASTATPQEMVAMFNAEKVRMFNTNGISHGTVTARINDEENFEITTLRIDVKTDGRHAEVAFTKNWVLDASRRDLTINSMFLGLDGSVYDWFHGFDDLKQHRVAFVGRSCERIQEDYLRILRYFRFYGRIAQKADAHDPATIATIAENIDGLKMISGPRIWGEVQKILNGNFALDILRKMFECNAAESIGLPENANYDELNRVHEVSKNPFKDIAFHPITILTTQLNNIQDAIQLNARLQMSAYDRDLAMFLAQNKEEYRDVDELLPYQKRIVLSIGNQVIYKEYFLELLKYHGKRDLHDKLHAWRIGRVPINGSQLSENGVPSGKKMGRVMEKLKIIWCEHSFKITTNELLNFVPEIMSELSEEDKKISPTINKTIQKKHRK